MSLRSVITGNTLYGAETPAGTGISIGTGNNVAIFNNIIYGFTTGISKTTSVASTTLGYNNFFNNTTDVSNVTKGANDIALNPTFVDAVNADFRIGTNLKAKGFPGAFNGAGSSCIGYLDIGAVQREETGTITFGGTNYIDDMTIK